MEKPVVTRIIDAATVEFSREGFGGARMDKIAALAGVNKAALYYHVGDKAELFEAVLVENFMPFAERLEKAITSAIGAGEKVRVLIEEFAAKFSSNPALPKMMALEMIRGGGNLSPKIREQLARVVACTAGVLSECQKEGHYGGVKVFPMHLAIVGPLAFYFFTEDVRAKALQERADIRGLSVTLQEMVGFLQVILTKEGTI